MSERKDLVQIIRDNPGCVAVVDNDSWELYRADPSEAPDDDGYDAWLDANRLASDSDVIPLGDGGYGSGASYGADIMQALAVIVGIKIQSV